MKLLAVVAITVAALGGIACESTSSPDPAPATSQATTADAIEESNPPERQRRRRRPVKDPCDRRGGDETDVDGDGRTDRVHFDFRHAAGFVGVCTDDGMSDEVRGPAAEVWFFADVDGDGGDEIFVGLTGMTAYGVEVFVFRNGKLRAVTTREGAATRIERMQDRLWLKDGIDNYFRSKNVTAGMAFGCDDRNGDGIGDLSQVIVVDRGDVFRWRRWDYTFRGTLAVLIGKDSGTMDARRGRYAVSEAATELVSPCDFK